MKIKMMKKNSKFKTFPISGFRTAVYKMQKNNVKESFKEWQVAVFERDNYKCAICGKERETPQTLHPMHIFPREYLPLRFDINNALTGCAGCHIWAKHAFHQNPLFFVEWLRKNRPLQYEYLMSKLPQFCLDSGVTI